MRLDTPKVGLRIVTLQQTLAIVAREMLCVIHYIRQLETLESLKINANAFMSSPISYCDDMYLCQIG